MVKQAVGQAVRPRRLYEAFLQIELHQGDPLDQIPGKRGGHHVTGLGMLLPHHEPHFGRIAAPARAAQPLQETGDRIRRVQMECPLKPADIDAQLQRGGGADAHEGFVILHLLFRAFPVGSRQVSVVDQKTVRLMIGKDQAFFVPGMLEDIGQAGIGGLRRGIGRRFRLQRPGRDLFPFIGLREGLVEMLHAEPPDLLRAFEARDHGLSPAAGRQKTSRLLRIAYRRRKADPPRIAARQPAQTLDKAEGLQASVAAEQGMDLVDDDKAQIAEKRRDLHVLVDEQGLQRFRRDLQDARRLLQQPALVGLRDIAVPARHRDALLLAELIQAAELIVDQRLERRDVQHAHRPRRILVQQRQDRKKRGFGLSRSGRGRQQHIFVRTENGVARRVLNAAQALPARTVDIILYKRRVAFKDIHSVNSAKPASASSDTASGFA